MTKRVHEKKRNFFFSAHKNQSLRHTYNHLTTTTNQKKNEKQKKKKPKQNKNRKHAKPRAGDDKRRQNLALNART